MNLYGIVGNTYAVAAVALVLTCNCGEPTSSVSSKWVKVAALYGNNRQANGIASYLDIVWFVGSNPATGDDVVIRYAKGVWQTEYVSPYDPHTTYLLDISVTGPDQPRWAGGGRLAENGMIPYLITSGPKGRKWEEVALPPGWAGVIPRIFPMPDGRGCWFILDGRFNYEDRFAMPRGILVSYRDGVFRRFDELGEVSVAVATITKTAGVIYAVEQSFTVENPKNAPYARIFISEDYGKRWYSEEVAADFIPGQQLEGLYAGCANEKSLLLVGDLRPYPYTCLIKRVGAAGRGEYCLSFLSPTGPLFNNIKTLAIRERGNKPSFGADVVAGGENTSIVINEDNVYFEEIPFPLDIYRVEAATGHGFWGLGYSYPFKSTELLYHP